MRVWPVFLVVPCLWSTFALAKKDYKTESRTKQKHKTATPTRVPVPPPTPAPIPLPNDLDCPLLKGTQCLNNNDNSNTDRQFCAALRGNGASLGAHFVVLARLVEVLGPVQGLAGGSSGAAVAFGMESIQSHPLVRMCGTVCCTLEEQVVRISFLLKSVEMVGRLASLLGALDWIVNAVPDELQDVVNSIGTDDFNGAVIRLGVALSDPASDFVQLVNPELVNLLVKDIFTNQQALIPHILDIVDVVTNEFASRADTDPLVTVRPFLINYRRFVAKLDIIGSFFAGLEPLNLQNFAYLMDQCARPEIVLGKKWKEIEQHVMDNGQTCRDLYRQLYFDFIDTRDESHPRRMDDEIGSHGPVIVSTAVLTGDTFDLWKQATIDYVQHPSSVNFTPNFDDFAMGYFGDKVSLERLETELSNLYPNDFKAKRFLSLGQDTWKEVLFATISEPVLSKGVILDEDKKWVSIGGWNDELPTQVLKASGCDNVIMLNGAGGEFAFPGEMLIGLRASEDDSNALIGFDETSTPENSSYANALAVQDASVCTQWKILAMTDVLGAIEMGYEGEFMSDDRCLQDVGAIEPRDGGVGEFNFGCIPIP